MNVWVVNYVSFYQGEFSSAGVVGVYASKEAAEKAAAERRSNTTDIEVEEVEVKS